MLISLRRTGIKLDMRKCSKTSLYVMSRRFIRDEDTSRDTPLGIEDTTRRERDNKSQSLLQAGTTTFSLSPYINCLPVCLSKNYQLQYYF